jgi:hypothetical protein
MLQPVAYFYYEKSLRTAQVFAEHGWDCYCVDIAHEKTKRISDNICVIKDDLRYYKIPEFRRKSVKFFAAMPPCDHLAVSGARWFKGKGLRKLAESIELFAIAAETAEDLDCPYFIENPVSTISTYWRKPDHIFDPKDYSGFEREDHYLKRTCLWTGGGFKMPEKYTDDSLGAPDKNRILKHSPGEKRKDLRSETPLGFMRALYKANFRS